MTNGFSIPVQKGNSYINEIIRLSVNDKTHSIIYICRRQDLFCGGCRGGGGGGGLREVFKDGAKEKRGVRGMGQLVL